MIGFYDYTMYLTYLSLISAGTGIVVSLSGSGHPYLGVFFLLFSGLCDAFDGIVARTKKDRTEMQKKYGIQLDSLADIVAFGVLPACVGVALLRTAPSLQNVFEKTTEGNLWFQILWIAMYVVLVAYMLAALIRLAYFNVTEEERQKKEDGVRKSYTGLPVTSASIIFPTVMLFKYLLPFDISFIYFPVVFVTGFAFLGKFKMPKLKLRGIMVLVIIGVIETLALVAFFYLKSKGIL